MALSAADLRRFLRLVQYYAYLLGLLLLHLTGFECYLHVLLWAYADAELAFIVD